MSTTSYFSSWWGGTKTSDSNEEVQTPPPSANRRPPTRSQTKKRKTIDGGSDVETDEGATLEEIKASLRMHHSQAEGRQKKSEERERKAEARAQRIESLLKRVLENQKKILAEIRNNEEDDEETDQEVEEDKEAKASTPGGRRKSVGRRPWTKKEYDLVAMGLALHGRDSTALVEVLVNRNRDQINGFLKRNWRNLAKDQKQYPVRTEEDREALLEAIASLREEESDDEEEDDSNEGNEEEDSGDNEADKKKGRKINKGLWTDEERERLFKGIAVYGKTDFKTLSAVVKTRTPIQTRMYIYRRLQEEDAPNQTVQPAPNE